MNNKCEAYIGHAMVELVKTSAYKDAMNARVWSLLWLDEGDTVMGVEELVFHDVQLIAQKVGAKKLNAFLLGFGNAPYSEVGFMGWASRYFRGIA